MSCPQRKVPVEVAEALVELIKGIEGLLKVVEGLADARVVEQRVHEELKAIDRAVMEVCVGRKAQQAVESDVREVRCPHCKEGWALLLKSDAERYAVTVRGRVEYRRPLYRCTERNTTGATALAHRILPHSPRPHVLPRLRNAGAADWFRRHRRDVQKPDQRTHGLRRATVGCRRWRRTHGRLARSPLQPALRRPLALPQIPRGRMIEFGHAPVTSRPARLPRVMAGKQTGFASIFSERKTSFQ